MDAGAQRSKIAFDSGLSLWVILSPYPTSTLVAISLGTRISKRLSCFSKVYDVSLGLAVLLKHGHASESPGGLIKSVFWATVPRVSDSVGLE